MFQLSKGTIEDYYPLETVAEIINDHLSPEVPVTREMFDDSKHGDERLTAFRRVMYDNGAGDSVEYLKRLLGSEGTKAIRDRVYQVDDELKVIFERVQRVVSER